MDAPRVRFAPSPTGFLHVGGARTALFNWLFARKRGGTFVLRIEDTDRERSSEEMTRAILDALDWLGLDVDEGPHHQADGLERHRDDVARLVASGHAYRCFCAAGDEGEGSAVGGCPGGCRRIDDEASARRAADGELHAIRFRVPAGETAWEDAVHGHTSFPNDSLEDFVLLRSDGTPVYNLAVVSDDVAMEITHVIRGDDHLSNTPKQVLLYRALGADLPTFAHVPMILGADGKRLSKRHGAASVEAYREEGILPEAMVNFLALLGWSPGDDREVMTRDELIEAFGLDRVLKRSAVFDADKLRWLNGQHVTAAPAERLAGPVLEGLAADGLDRDAVAGQGERLHAVIDAVKDRARTVDELVRQVRPFFADSVTYEQEAVERFWEDRKAAAERLDALDTTFREVDAWEPDALERELRALAERREEGAGALIHPLRVALMGVAVSPGIFTVLALMGPERTHRGIRDAIEHLRAGTPTG